MNYYIVQSDGTQVPFDGVGQVQNSDVIAANVTLTEEDSGKTYLIGTDALTITLPTVRQGVKYTFINTGIDGTVALNISPAVADNISGTVANAAADSVLPGNDDKDAINTKATANLGDRISIEGTDFNTWVVTEGVGIWAEEV